MKNLYESVLASSLTEVKILKNDFLFSFLFTKLSSLINNFLDLLFATKSAKLAYFLKCNNK